MFTKVIAFLGATVAALLLYISSMKKSAVEEKLKESEAKSEYKDEASEALVEGLENENKSTPDRTYFSD